MHASIMGEQACDMSQLGLTCEVGAVLETSVLASAAVTPQLMFGLCLGVRTAHWYGSIAAVHGNASSLLVLAHVAQ